MAEPIHGHIVLTSLETISVRTLEELDRVGERVVIIASGGDSRNRDAISRVPALVRIVEGDPRNADVLRAAGIEHAKALILAEVDDVGNLHAALAARHVNPTLHVVIRTFDEELGQRIETAMTDVVTLSSSAIAAPGFVSAILDEDTDERTIDMLGRTLVLRHAPPDDPGVLLVLADDAREPVQLFPGTGANAVGDDAPPNPRSGDLLCLVDPAGASGNSTTPATRAPAPVVSAARRSRARPRPTGWLSPSRVDTRFWVLGGVLAAITIVSALLLASATGLNLVEAIYDVVGAFFGGIDSSVANSDALRIFAIVLTLVGAAALAAFYGLIADVLLSTRLSNLLGPRPTDVHDHVIVVGLGTIGFRIASLLRERGIPVAAAERARMGPSWRRRTSCASQCSPRTCAAGTCSRHSTSRRHARSSAARTTMRPT